MDKRIVQIFLSMAKVLPEVTGTPGNTPEVINNAVKNIYSITLQTSTNYFLTFKCRHSFKTEECRDEERHDSHIKPRCKIHADRYFIT